MEETARRKPHRRAPGPPGQRRSEMDIYCNSCLTRYQGFPAKQEALKYARAHVARWHKGEAEVCFDGKAEWVQSIEPRRVSGEKGEFMRKGGER